MSDDFLWVMDISVLMQLNGPSQQAAPAVSATEKQAPKSIDPETKMALNLERLKDNPTTYESEQDNRIDTFHRIRWAGGPACGSQGVWAHTRSSNPLDGVEPIAAYDMETIGLGGHVTARGWIEIHNPASKSLSLKLFSSNNVGNATASSKRITFSESDDGFDVGESMKEISDLGEFKTALRALKAAMRYSLPWNFSVEAIDGFLQNSAFCAVDLVNVPNKASVLTGFVNYALGINAQRWQRKMPFLSTGDLEQQWPSFFRTRCPAASHNAQNMQQQQRRQFTNFGTGNFNRKPFGPRPGAPTSSQPYHTPGPKAVPSNLIALTHSVSEDQLCRRFNFGVCPNQWDSCFKADGTKLFHMCSAMKNGQSCKGNHPTSGHR